jgi:hypothetical protein
MTLVLRVFVGLSFSLGFILFSCSNKNSCEFTNVSTIYIQNTEDSTRGFLHRVLVEGMNYKCRDSSIVYSILNNYMDTVQNGKPVSTVVFYESADYIDPVEQSIDHRRSLPNFIALIHVIPIENFPKYYFGTGTDKYIESEIWLKQKKIE